MPNAARQVPRDFGVLTSWNKSGSIELKNICPKKAGIKRSFPNYLRTYRTGNDEKTEVAPRT
jgi:hypothetical protein